MLQSLMDSLLKRQTANAVKRAVSQVRAGARARAGSERMLPSFLIIGVQRGGSTSLYRYLSEHPRVQPPLVKEVQFFTLNYSKGIDWYRAHFPLASVGVCSFDASPYYLFHPLAAERAAASLGDVRMVALLRNPVDRAFSHYRHNLSLGIEKLGFDAALEAERARLAGEEEKLAGDPTYESLAHRRYSYLARGNYAEQLERWFSHFDRNRFLVLPSEEFFADTARVFAEVLKFVGLPAFELKAYEAYTRSRPGSVADVPPEVRKRLEEHFRDPNRRLAELLGRDLPWS